MVTGGAELMPLNVMLPCIVDANTTYSLATLIDESWRSHSDFLRGAFDMSSDCGQNRT